MTRGAVVVGAGIGGLATAVGLRRAGWAVTVLERWPEVVDLGTALGLWPEAQAALDTLGVGEQVRRLAVPYRQASVRTPAGRPLADLPLARIERRAGSPVLLLSRTALMRVLLDAAAGMPIRTGVAVTEPAALRSEHDLVVGADGVGSVVRPAFFGDRSGPRGAGLVAWRGVIEGVIEGAAEGAAGAYGEVWGRGLLFGLTPQEDGCTNWYASVAVDDPAEVQTLDQVRARYAGWCDPVPAVLARADRASSLRHEIRYLGPPLRTFVADGVALVGDAAHAMTPHLGQGGCQALLDAAALTGALVAEPDVDAALRRYDGERRRPAQRVAAASRRAGRLMQASHLVAPRDAAVRALGRLIA